jgi:cell division protein FtsL
VEKTPRFRVAKETRVADLDSPVLRVNRRAERRKFSTFNMMLLLFGVATAIVIYIGHIINVNHLAIEADKLAQQYDDLLRTRAKLQAEIDSKSGRERIVSLATRQLGLKPLTGQARWIVVENAPGGDSAP